MGPLGTILVILGPKGAPKRHTEAQISIFIDFRMDFGSLLGPILNIILRLSVIWGDERADSFQVHVFW